MYLLETLLCSSVSSLRQRTPLHLAAQGGHKQTVEILIRKKANINTKDVDGVSTIRYALFNSCLQASEKRSGCLCISVFEVLEVMIVS